MISSQTSAHKYHTTIGIECHVQLNTKTKLFAGVGNDARSADPNTLVSHICFGLPGALPVLNDKVIELASKMAFALGTKPQAYSMFERKHYFYPDLPKGYQISQLTHPIIVGGEVIIPTESGTRSIQINRVQIEEDAGKNTHPTGKDYSLVDLNRAGTPLLEIVSEPDMHTAQEARAYVRELYLIVKYIGISDADLYHGNMRFDVNVSISRDKKLGTRTETKNLNSFRSVEKAVEYEVKRQTELLEKGQPIVQETRGWDEAKQKTTSQRGKEEAHDYRYMPEPDVPPIELTEPYIKQIGASMPKLPNDWRTYLNSLGLSTSYVDTLIEAEVDNTEVSYLELIEQHPTDYNLVKQLVHWFVNIEIPLRRDHGSVQATTTEQRTAIYQSVYKLVSEDKLSSTNAKALLGKLLPDGNPPKNIEALANKLGFIQDSSEDTLGAIIDSVIHKNPQAASDVSKGEIKAIGFLVGQVMKQSKGQANPALAQKILRKKLQS